MQFIVIILISMLYTAIYAHSDHSGQHAGLSESEHFKSGKHDTEYDHDAFLGRGHGHDYDELSPEEAKRRLRIIVEKIDTDKNGFVDDKELLAWIEHQRTGYMWDTIDQIIRQDDKNRDGKLTWKEYKAAHYGEWDDEASMDEKLRIKIEKDHNKFNHSDANKDGYLTRDEYVYFRHPEESKHMKEIAVDEVIDEIDKDGDRFVNVLTGIGFYTCEKFADILATEKALSVDFIFSLIKNTKTKNSTLRTE